jgi:hypothetical protein
MTSDCSIYSIGSDAARARVQGVKSLVYIYTLYEDNHSIGSHRYSQPLLVRNIAMHYSLYRLQQIPSPIKPTHTLKTRALHAGRKLGDDDHSVVVYARKDQLMHACLDDVPGPGASRCSLTSTEPHLHTLLIPDYHSQINEIATGYA